MHLIESYALTCGLKIDRPFIYDTFYPTPEGKYITLQIESNSPSRQYKYWQLVVDLIKPILSKSDIEILQIGSKNDKALKDVVCTSGKTSISQAHYLIRNSQMHVGIDSFGVHVASGLGKKIVALYSSRIPKNAGAYWSNTSDFISIQSPRGSRKPSYSIDENPRTINEIKPETVANSVLELLDIQERVSIETLFIGENFNSETLFGFLPNQVILSDKITPDIRMDLKFDEKGLCNQLAQQKSIITTNKAISRETILNFKDKIARVIYLVEENDDPSFPKFLFDNGAPFICVSELSQEKLDSKKINYYKFCQLHKTTQSLKEKEIAGYIRKSSENLKFKTNYIISSEKNNFPSHHHLLDNKKCEDIFSFFDIEKTDLFLNDLKNLWIVKYK